MTGIRDKIIAALLIIGLSYVAFNQFTTNRELNKKIDALNDKVTAVEKTNKTTNHYYYEQKTKDQQLIKDAGRSQLLFDKPGLVEIKINNSFDLYMEEFNK
ncbi:hypothetical protein POP12_231 [Pectobacterium phage POP12]|nr:hypothetical protein POP12_231 [Pectobacterium phage POP12]